MDVETGGGEQAGGAPQSDRVARPPRRIRALVRQGVRRRRALGAKYRRHNVLLWPYALGWYSQKLYIRAFIVGGGFRDEHWVPLDELEALRMAGTAIDWIPPLAGPAIALTFFDRLDCACEDYAPADPRSGS
jgi:hypothetical protein